VTEKEWIVLACIVLAYLAGGPGLAVIPLVLLLIMAHDRKPRPPYGGVA
jgi:hypothetical protein